MSHRARILSLFLVVLLCAQLIGCNRREGDAGQGTTGSAPPTGTSGTTTGSDASPTEPQEIVSIPNVCIAVSDLKDMQIVYPAALAEDASFLSCVNYYIKQVLEQKYGVSIPIVTDNRTRYPEREYEFLIGNTNREETAAMAELLLREYAYEQRGTKILINGGDLSTLKQAVIRFSNDVIYLKLGGEHYLYKDSFNYFLQATHLAENARINDVLVRDYAVVYPQNATLYEKQLAVRLADRLTLLCGKALAVYSDATPYVAGNHEILVGKTNRPFSPITTEGIAIESGNGMIALVGSTAYDLGVAQQSLLDVFEMQLMLGQNLTLQVKQTVASAGAVSMMSYNIYGVASSVYQERVDNICHLITKYLPDIVAFQEPAADFMNLTYTNLEQYYGYYLGEPRHGTPPVTYYGANSYAPILYAKDRYEVVEGDTKWMTDTPGQISKLDGSEYYRIYTYVILRDLQTGAEFLVANLHLDFDSDVQVKTLQYMFKQLQHDGYNDLPVFLLGDMNAGASSAALQLMLDTAGFDSAEELAGSPVGTAGSMIDWILATPSGVTGLRYTVCRDIYEDSRNQSHFATMPSDHPAVYAKFYISATISGMHHDWSAAFEGV